MTHGYRIGQSVRDMFTGQVGRIEGVKSALLVVRFEGEEGLPSAVMPWSVEPLKVDHEGLS